MLRGRQRRNDPVLLRLSLTRALGSFRPSATTGSTRPFGRSRPTASAPGTHRRRARRRLLTATRRSVLRTALYVYRP
ncbi:hypothetical protein Mapa_003342 [Marchantia paleacea]|nr:hypothetical protein Mapa_003342 [Marchantia paleacea]